MVPGDTLLDLRGIQKTYQMGEVAFQVLHGISLTVKEGEFVSILGPSGSGKSTLMNIIGCLDTADEGEYLLNGERVDGLSERKMAYLRNSQIGFVFQNFQLLPRLSALDNVMLPLLYGKVPKKDRVQLARNALIRVGLGSKLENLPKQLSGGQQQRVAIARALVTNPSLLLCDEPTGALDRNTGTQIMKIFTELHDEGKTIVMITHDKRIASYASRTVYILDGKIYSAEEYAIMEQEEVSPSAKGADIAPAAGESEKEPREMNRTEAAPPSAETLEGSRKRIAKLAYAVYREQTAAKQKQEDDKNA